MIYIPLIYHLNRPCRPCWGKVNGGHHRWSSARQDITELRSESKMLANYVRICGAAVWSLKGNAKTGVVTEPGIRGN